MLFMGRYLWIAFLVIFWPLAILFILTALVMFMAQNKNRSGENFKTLFEINETSVRRAIKDNADFVHEELGNLANLIRKLATGID